MTPSPAHHQQIKTRVGNSGTAEGTHPYTSVYYTSILPGGTLQGPSEHKRMRQYSRQVCCEYGHSNTWIFVICRTWGVRM